MRLSLSIPLNLVSNNSQQRKRNVNNTHCEVSFVIPHLLWQAFKCKQRFLSRTMRNNKSIKPCPIRTLFWEASFVIKRIYEKQYKWSILLLSITHCTHTHSGLLSQTSMCHWHWLQRKISKNLRMNNMEWKRLTHFPSLNGKSSLVEAYW